MPKMYRSQGPVQFRGDPILSASRNCPGGRNRDCSPLRRKRCWPMRWQRSRGHGRGCAVHSLTEARLSMAIIGSE
jgi:hypothetical protein